MDNARAPGGEPRRSPVAYFVLAYAISWATMVPMAIAGAEITQGEVWPTHLPFLAGPALAAVVVTLWSGGLPALRELAARAVRWRVPLQWWLFALGSPLAFIAVALAIAAAGAGDVPPASDFGRFNALPAAAPVVTLVLIVILNGLGEEIGWRGYALPALQRRFSPFASTLILALLWAAWHLPAFFVVRSYDGLLPAGLLPFALGLTAGAFVLTWLYNRSGGSILLVAVWHGGYNFGSGTAAADGLIAGVVSTIVMVLGFALAALEYRARRGGHASVIGPLPDGRAPRGFWLTNHFANPFMRVMLRSPLAGTIGRHVALIRYRGRRSGRRYEHPVEYARDGERVWILPVHADQKTWWRNLRGGADVELRLAGGEFRGTGIALEPPGDQRAIAEGLTVYLKQLPRAGRALGLAGANEPPGADDPAMRAASRHTVIVRVDLDR